MRSEFIILLACLCLFSACTIRPHGVLSSRQMRDVLYDLHRADGILQTQGYNYGHDEQLAAYYGVVLQKHGVTQAQFDSSLVWYTDNPKIFNKIYPKVMARLQSDLDALPEEEKAVRKPEQEILIPTRHVIPLDSLRQRIQYGVEYEWKATEKEQADSLKYFVLALLPEQE